MVKKKAAHHTSTAPELDSIYILKLVMYLIMGAIWVRIQTGNSSMQLPIPIGFVVGFIFAMHEHFRIDRKIEYAVLLAAMLVGFWSHAGMYIML